MDTTLPVDFNVAIEVLLAVGSVAVALWTVVFGWGIRQFLTKIDQLASKVDTYDVGRIERLEAKVNELDGQLASWAINIEHRLSYLEGKANGR